jgi:hypothetical protein
MHPTFWRQSVSLASGFVWQLAVGSWQLAVGSWQLAVGSWQLAVGQSPKGETD